MLVLHCNWSGHALHLWAEDLGRARQKPAAADAGHHPFIAGHAELEHAVREAGILHTGTHAKPTELALLLPASLFQPFIVPLLLTAACLLAPARACWQRRLQ